MSGAIRVLIVDDSAYVRKVVKQMLSRDPGIEVVGTARDGAEALELVEQLRPDVVTCDLIMPDMDGPTFVREQMRRRAVPILLMSVASGTGAEALAALEFGAIDFLQKPTTLASEKMFEVSDELVEKVRMAAGVPLASLAPVEPVVVPPAPVAGVGRFDVVVIGISTGGPHALRQMIPQLPAAFPVPIVIVMHMPVGYTEMYAERLDEASALGVREAREGAPVEAGTVMLARAGWHLTFHREPFGRVVAHLDERPDGRLFRPSVDVLFQSAAETFGSRVLGIVMTGMGDDGRQGAAWIKAKGGQIFTEAKETCIVYGMPGVVVDAGLSDRSVMLGEMARTVLEVV